MSPNNISYQWIMNYPPAKTATRGRVYRDTKRLFDLFFVLLLAPFWFPIFCVVYLLIKIESRGGTVLFRQTRTGRGGRRFAMYKFRTMVENAEALKEELQHLNELQWPDFKITNDPRVTRIGKFLRKTSLDELPQLLNVIKGDMSLVGPRPTSFSSKEYKLWHTERLDVIPGITGLWQLAGRGETEFDDRLKMDIAYIERRSFWIDILILFRTIFSVIKQKGTH